MEKLKFLGRGSAFNTKEGNTSAYYIVNNHLILFDCGESTFERIIKTNILENIKKIDIFITHLHSDHVGSLSSLIYYLYYIKNIVPCITYKDSKRLIEYLNITGNFDGYIINTEKKVIENIEIIPKETSHTEIIKNGKNIFLSYGYYINFNNNKIYFSGDTNEIAVNLDEIDILYQDCCSYDEVTVHLSFNKLLDLVDKKYRHKVYIMHIDSDELIEKALKNGFNIVEIE